MAEVVINQYGDKTYFDDEGEIHREDGPAMIFADGHKQWYVTGSWKMLYYPRGLYEVKLGTMRYFSASPNGFMFTFEGTRLWPTLK